MCVCASPEVLLPIASVSLTELKEPGYLVQNLQFLSLCLLLPRPLVYTVCVLLPVAYIIGLIFTLKTHSHIYDIHVGVGPGMRLSFVSILCVRNTAKS